MGLIKTLRLKAAKRQAAVAERKARARVNLREDLKVKQAVLADQRATLKDQQAYAKEKQAYKQIKRDIRANKLKPVTGALSGLAKAGKAVAREVSASQLRYAQKQKALGNNSPGFQMGKTANELMGIKEPQVSKPTTKRKLAKKVVYEYQ